MYQAQTYSRDMHNSVTYDEGLLCRPGWSRRLARCQ